MSLCTWLATRLLNFKFKEYGTMLTLNVDPKAKTLSLSALLKGETEPMIVTAGYTLGDGTVTFQNINISRPWMNSLVNEFTGGQYTLPLTSLSGTILKLLL